MATASAQENRARLGFVLGLAVEIAS